MVLQDGGTFILPLISIAYLHDFHDTLRCISLQPWYTYSGFTAPSLSQLFVGSFSTITQILSKMVHMFRMRSTSFALFALFVMSAKRNNYFYLFVLPRLHSRKTIYSHYGSTQLYCLQQYSNLVFCNLFDLLPKIAPQCCVVTHAKSSVVINQCDR